MKPHAHLSILGMCLLCIAYGTIELLLGHAHHAWLWLSAAAPGAASARLALTAHRAAKEGQ